VSNQDFLQSHKQAFVLDPSSDSDAEPAGNRFTIVMPDEDSSLSKRIRDGRG
jgi:hypothetical protein